MKSGVSVYVVWFDVGLSHTLIHLWKSMYTLFVGIILSVHVIFILWVFCSISLICLRLSAEYFFIKSALCIKSEI